MRTIKTFLLILLCALTIMAVAQASPAYAAAAEQIALDETNFPDAAFRQWLLDYIADEDGILWAERVRGKVEIDCSGRGIANLKGIEFFVGLRSLDCSNNRLTSLDVSANRELMQLNCANNRLTSLDVSANWALDFINCENNGLTSLDLSGNAALTETTVVGAQTSNLGVLDGVSGAWTLDLAGLADARDDYAYVTIASPNATMNTQTGTVTFATEAVPTELRYSYETGVIDAPSMDVTLAIDGFAITYLPGKDGEGNKTIDIKERGTDIALRGRLFDVAGLQYGWTLTDGDTIAYDPEEVYTTDAPLTVYPAWMAETPGEELSVTYKPGKYGEGRGLTEHNGAYESYRFQGARFTRAGYRQVGWATRDGGGKWVDLGELWETVASYTLYPVWEQYALTEYLVYYQPGELGAGKEQIAIKTEGEPLTLADALFTRDGHIQSGWTTSDGQTTYALGAPYTDDASITLIPTWQAFVYTVTYSPGPYASGTAYSVSKQAGVPLVLLGVWYTRDGYTQVGWATTDGEKTFGLGVDYNDDASITLVPVWESKVLAQFMVRYTPGAHGSGDEQTEIKTEGVPIPLAGVLFTRDGYTQVGWTTTDGQTKYDLGVLYTDDAHITLQPVWRSETTYTVRYVPGAYGKGDIQTQTKYAGEPMILADALFTRDGFTQSGWATIDGQTTYALGGEYTDDVSIGLVPVWEVKKYNLNIVDSRDGSRITEKHPAGAQVTVRANGADAGSAFQSWIPTFSHQIWKTMEYTFIMPAENVTVRAMYGPSKEKLYGIALTPNTLLMETEAYQLLDVDFTPKGITQTGLTWKSSDESVAIVDKNGKVTACGVGDATITATSTAYSDILAECTVTVVERSDTSFMQQGLDKVTVSAGKTVDVDTFYAGAYVWASDNPRVASVSEDGVVSAEATGSTIVRGTRGGVQSAPTPASKSALIGDEIAIEVSVVAKGRAVTEVTLAPKTLTLAMGETGTLDATIAPTNADDPRIVWRTDNAAVAVVDDAGCVTGMRTGEATITAVASSGVRATAKITVTDEGATPTLIAPTSIAILPDTRTQTVGEAIRLDLLTTPVGATTGAVTWTSDRPDVATVDATGLVAALAEGEAIITATTQAGLQSTCVLRVRAASARQQALTLAVDTLAIAKGTSFKLNGLTGFKGSWTIDDPTIASVSAKGVLKPKKTGQATLRFTVGAAVGKSKTFMGKALAAGDSVDIALIVVGKGKAVTRVTLKGADAIAPDERVELTATIKPKKATHKELIWNTSDPAVAMVDNLGIVTGKGPGTATITATATSGITQTHKIHVYDAVVRITLNKTKLSIKRGKTYPLAVTEHVPAGIELSTVIWKSSDPDIAKVNPVTGEVTAISKGKATITATEYASKRTATCKVTVK